MNCLPRFQKHRGLRCREWIDNTGSWKLFMSSVPYTRATTCRTRGKFTVPPCAPPSTFANGESLHMGVQRSSQDLGWSNGNADMQRQPHSYEQCIAHRQITLSKLQVVERALEKLALPLIHLDLCTVTACKEERRRKGTADGDGDVAESEPFLANGICPHLPAPIFVSSRSLQNPDSELAVVLPRSSGPH